MGLGRGGRVGPTTIIPPPTSYLTDLLSVTLKMLYCLTSTVSANRAPWLDNRVSRYSRWETSQPPLIRPLRAPGPRAAWGRARGARRGFARRDRPREIPKFPTPPHVHRATHPTIHRPVRGAQDRRSGAGRAGGGDRVPSRRGTRGAGQKSRHTVGGGALDVVRNSRIRTRIPFARVRARWRCPT
eukprot:gene11611-biopygen6377